MTSVASKIFLLIIPFILLFSVAFAETTPPRADSDTTPPSSGKVSSGGSVSLQNPLGNKTLMQFLQDILGVIMVFAVPIIVFFIIYAGFNYVMARGDTGKIETAHRALLYAVVGGLLILGAWVIMEVIQGTVASFRS